MAVFSTKSSKLPPWPDAPSMSKYKGPKGGLSINPYNYSENEIELIFKNLNLDSEKTFVFSCGSGVTACVLGLANSIVSGKKPVIYDGSWSEYGLK